MNRKAGTEQNLISIVFYHLHGQTSWLTVSENGNENSWLVIFAPELHLSFAQIKLSQLLKNSHESIKLESKMGLKKWNQEFKKNFKPIFNFIHRL